MANNDFSTTAQDIDSLKPNISKLDQVLALLPFEKFRNPPSLIAVLKLEGTIGVSSPLKSTLSIDNLNATIEETFKLSKLRALCLVINSPGGSPVQSELIAKRILQLAAEHNIAVYSFIEDIGASGGYWLACIGDEIYASKSSIIGSIGVVAAGFGFNEAIKKLGVERRIYTQGKNKSLLDPFSPEKEEDIKIIKKIQSDIHQHFIEFVKSRRGGKITQADELIFTGEVWAGQVAEDLGLIDGIDDMHSFLAKKFGKNIKIKYMHQKQSWLKKRLGLGTALNMQAVVQDIISYIEHRLFNQKWF